MSPADPLTLPAVLASGLLDGLNPCAFSVLLSLVAVMLAGAALAADPRPHLWKTAGAYVGGMFVTYLLLGLSIVGTVSLVSATHLPIRLMGLAVVTLGLWVLKDAVLPDVGVPLAMPRRWHDVVRRALARTTPGGLFVAGGLVGLCTLPCSGAIYLGVLVLLAREPLVIRVPYLALYNLMFVAPLLVLVASVTNRRVFNRLAHAYLQRKHLARAVVGAATVTLGLIILVTA
ncbi:MAG: hypothetical protein K6W08_05070 [Firmicutes bacterium]|nr:hypothetical protein [Bacillota bacterium]